MKHQNKDIYSQYKEKVNNGIIVTSLGALLLISVLKKEILIINQPLQREVLPIITAAGFIVSLIGLVMLFKNKSRLCRLEAEGCSAHNPQKQKTNNQKTGTNQKSKQTAKAAGKGGQGNNSSYSYYYCVSCGKKLRINGGQGRLQITCPVCGHSFTVNQGK